MIRARSSLLAWRGISPRLGTRCFRLGTRRNLFVTCSTSDELAHAVNQLVSPGQTVAELGSSLRHVSKTICQSLEHRGKAVLVDTQRKHPKTTFSIAREFSSLFEECQNVIIKSAALNMYASRLIHGQKWIESRQRQQETDPEDFPKYNLPGKIVATVGVKQYRDTIPFTVSEGDAVLEIGCHVGTTTALLNKASGSSGYSIGIDVGAKIIKSAEERHPEIPFAVGDAWKTAALLRIQQRVLKSLSLHPPKRQIGFDVVYVDVGGLSGSDGVLEALMLLSNIINGLEPKHLVIKSQCMRRLSSTLVPYWQIQKPTQKRSAGRLMAGSVKTGE